MIPEIYAFTGSLPLYILSIDRLTHSLPYSPYIKTINYGPQFVQFVPCTDLKVGSRGPST